MAPSWHHNGWYKTSTPPDPRFSPPILVFFSSLPSFSLRMADDSNHASNVASPGILRERPCFDGVLLATLCYGMSIPLSKAVHTLMMGRMERCTGHALHSTHPSFNTEAEARTNILGDSHFFRYLIPPCDCGDWWYAEGERTSVHRQSGFSWRPNCVDRDNKNFRS